MRSNHRPIIQGTDKGIWRRIRAIPFIAEVEEGKIDKHYKRRFYGERAGILAWMVRGCIDWQTFGLNEPKAVKEETDKYKQDMDTTGIFLLDSCNVTKQSFSKANLKQLYEVYTNWCKENGHAPKSKQRLSHELQERGFAYERSHVGVEFSGIEIL